MKRKISYFLVLLLILQALILSGCNSIEDDNTQTVLNENYTSVLGVLQNSQDLSEMQTYLIKWANKNDIRVSHDKYDNVIMSISASEGYEKTPSTILHATISPKSPENTANAVAVMQYIIKNVADHGFIRFIFTADSDNSQEGIKYIKKSYLYGDNFISLDNFIDNSLLIASAGADVYTMTRNIKRVKPSYPITYEISLQGLSGASITDETTRPNPITIIGDLLASAKSNGVLMEIASFDGGTDTANYPSRASATILINQNDVNKLTRLVEKNQERMYNRYSPEEPDFTYTLTEVQRPDSVLSFDDSSKLISFLYACINGNYLKNDDGEIIAKSNIGKISTEANLLEILIESRSKSSAVLEEMNTLFETVCGLCDISYNKKQIYPVWENNARFSYDENSDIKEDVDLSANPIVASFSEIIKEYSGQTLKYTRTLNYTANAIVASRNPDINTVCFGISPDNIVDQTNILLNFLAVKTI
ncbi:MAG: hypothetical protein PHW03_05005 [Eubacteriales bacterium]|nr:hypothetical protein [Eubacteriales bacterium]MDD4390143.1 hypothetical protein [Eubacteriales bacterium]